MEKKSFERIVREAVEELPLSIREKMDNVAICVEEKPSRRADKEEGAWKNSYLLGLYQGVPQNSWGRGFGDNLPDKITIFKDSIERFAKKEENIKKIVKRTVYHEIAHHFGFDEKKTRKLERKFYEKNRDN